MLRQKSSLRIVSSNITLRYGKTGNKKRATGLATLPQNELNSDVARFTTHTKPVLQQIRLLTGLNMSGKTRNIAIQLVLQQCCKTSCTFLLPVFPYLKHYTIFFFLFISILTGASLFAHAKSIHNDGNSFHTKLVWFQTKFTLLRASMEDL